MKEIIIVKIRRASSQVVLVVEKEIAWVVTAGVKKAYKNDKDSQLVFKIR